METTTKSKTGSKTKVAVGLVIAGFIIAAAGYGWVLRATWNGNTVIQYNTQSQDVDVAPALMDALSTDSSGGHGSQGDLSGNSNSNSNSNSNTNVNSSNSNTNSGGGTPGDDPGTK